MKHSFVFIIFIVFRWLMELLLTLSYLHNQNNIFHIFKDYRVNRQILVQYRLFLIVRLYSPSISIYAGLDDGFLKKRNL